MSRLPRHGPSASSNDLKPAPLAAAEPFVVIAIVSTNEQDNLVGVVSALSKSLYQRFRVAICENAGEEAFAKTCDALRGLSQLVPTQADQHNPNEELSATCPAVCFRFRGTGQLVTVLKAPRNLGYSGGVNACIKSAARSWDAVWVLNPDTFPEPDALGALVRRSREGPYGIVGSRMVDAGDGTIQTWGGLTWSALLGRGRLIGFGKRSADKPDIAAVERKIDFIIGASMFVPRAYIETVGMMDEDFFVYDEDVEWSLRRGAFKLGYAHDSVVRHVLGSTSGSSTTTHKISRFSMYLGERNRVLIARKRHPLWWPALAIIAITDSFVRLLLWHRSPRQFLIAFDGWLAGVAGETGMPGFMRAISHKQAQQFLQSAS